MKPTTKVAWDFNTPAIQPSAPTKGDRTLWEDPSVTEQNKQSDQRRGFVGEEGFKNGEASRPSSNVKEFVPTSMEEQLEKQIIQQSQKLKEAEIITQRLLQEKTALQQAYYETLTQFHELQRQLIAERQLQSQLQAKLAQAEAIRKTLEQSLKELGEAPMEQLSSLQRDLMNSNSQLAKYKKQVVELQTLLKMKVVVPSQPIGHLVKTPIPPTGIVAQQPIIPPLYVTPLLAGTEILPEPTTFPWAFNSTSADGCCPSYPK